MRYFNSFILYTLIYFKSDLKVKFIKIENLYALKRKRRFSSQKL